MARNMISYLMASFAPLFASSSIWVCEPAHVSLGSKAEKLDLSIRCPLCPRKRTYLPILELLPSPTLGERRHGGLARRLITVGRRAIFVLPKGERPRRALG